MYGRREPDSHMLLGRKNFLQYFVKTLMVTKILRKSKLSLF